MPPAANRRLPLLPPPSPWLKPLFAGTIFSSAFLLFLMQPLLAKQILPWFGGSAAVLVHDEAEASRLRATDWVLVARDAATLQRAGLAGASRPIEPIPGLRAWTDDFSNLFNLLK
jgi:hypothetical protein